MFRCGGRWVYNVSMKNRSAISKITAFCLAVLLCVSIAAAVAGCVTKKEFSLPFLYVEGEEVFSAPEQTVVLRGVNAGGLFVTEHWMTGFTAGSSPSDDYRSLTLTFLERFGARKTEQLWEKYREEWWSDLDFQICAEMGINVIRLPFTYMNVDIAAVKDFGRGGAEYDFSALEEFVDRAESYGIYTILDLHGAYGSQNGQDHSGQIIHDSEDVTFYSDERLMDLTVRLWEALSEHFKDDPAVAGYDILNEPGIKAGRTDRVQWDLYDRIYRAIRGTGDQHIVIFESCWDGKDLPRPSEYGWQNCIYSFHHYAGDSATYEEYCASWTAKIEEVRSMRFGIPLQMGEFTNYASVEKWEFSLGLLDSVGWHWTSWTYKVWGRTPWGMINVTGENADKVNADTDSYEEILRKFSCLHTSSCERYLFDGRISLESILALHVAMPSEANLSCNLT